MRQSLDLNDGWLFTKPGCKPEQVSLPHTWNAADGQDGGNDYFRGTCVYENAFAKPDSQRVCLEFPAAAMIADVYVNGKMLCHHEGGYSAFWVDVTDVLQERNVVRVEVNNEENNFCYPQKADFTFYGGLYRGVRLLCLPENHLGQIHVTPVVTGSSAEITVEADVVGEGVMTVEVAGQTVSAPAKDGKAAASLVIENVHLWDGVDDPYLYTAVVRLGEDEKAVRFGCRTFSFDTEKGFFLNGRSYPLRGVSRHQDWAGVGNALTMDHHRADMEIIREIGANTVRLAHYQQAQEFYDLCDENGLIVWAEIPYITCHMPGGRANTVSQMTELVNQCYNHPSIVCWGLSNEITASSQVTEDLLENHRILNDLCHRLDPSRVTTMAHAFMLEIDNPITMIPDIGSYNLYFGWYLGDLAQNDSFFDTYHARFPERIIGFSEYGADANPAFHNAAPEKGDYSEEYQALYHEHLLRCIAERPYLWATHVWNLFDFAADGRDEGGSHGVNQKGLVTMDRKLKKDAFYLYKAYWSKEPFLHLCGKRYVDRPEEKTEVKVYTNLSSVTLLVDGRAFQTKPCDKIVTFTVPITGRHEITAVSGSCTDRMTIQKVSEPNAAYFMGNVVKVVNWFDRDRNDPNCYSIKDKFGVLMSDPEARKVIAPMMDAAIASRGDVAKSANQNANLQSMLASMTMEGLLKMAGGTVPAEQVEALNAALQRIPKGS
ncbi:MAG: glycoside hydrolase family 2 protein [Clostridiales bacterium]|nr:glycoside hydrolase family 2 protein [Clostridiales bacterium]